MNDVLGLDIVIHQIIDGNKLNQLPFLIYQDIQVFLIFYHCHKYDLS